MKQKQIALLEIPGTPYLFHIRISGSQ